MGNLILSIMSLYLVTSVKHETRLNGYILTGIARFSGAAVFIFVDLFAFVIANLIQTYIAFQGYYKNKKEGEEQKVDINYSLLLCNYKFLLKCFSLIK